MREYPALDRSCLSLYSATYFWLDFLAVMNLSFPNLLVTYLRIFSQMHLFPIFPIPLSRISTVQRRDLSWSTSEAFTDPGAGPLQNPGGYN